MRAVANAGRSRLLLALLLVLLGVSAPAGPSVGGGHTGGHRTPVFESASALPKVHDDLQDHVRLFAVVRSVQGTPSPDTWWAKYAPAPGWSAPSGFSTTGETGRADITTAMSTPRSGRAPPLPRTL
ncbi:hypothetical protein [Umezawaea sp. NPDC059074]|uniref:hypothetical protein n=1 Tax=Umezawaea sp. NPDC059074 TaxID=3346716 RepID=UPI00369D643B